MNPANVQVFKAHNPTGYFVWDSKFTFGKFKGMKISSIQPKKLWQYLLWITHAINAEKFVIQLHPCILWIFNGWIEQHDYESKRSVWIGGEAVPYQMGEYYKKIISAQHSIPTEDTIAEFGEIEDVKAFEEMRNKKLSNTINELHQLLKEN